MAVRNIVPDRDGVCTLALVKGQGRRKDMVMRHGGDIYRNHVELDFSVNLNPLGMPESVRNALQGAVAACGCYPDPLSQELTEALARRLRLPGEYLLFGNGASELFMGLIHALKPENILIPVPSFYGYEYAAEAAEGHVHYLELQEKETFLPGQQLMDALAGEVDLLFLANPNNPTGQRLDSEYLAELLKRCRERDICVVLDECFMDFCGMEHSALSWVGQYPNLFLVRAFTKTYAIPGVRLGYLASSSPQLGDVRRQLPEWNLSVPAQAAGLACMELQGYEEETVRYVKQEREFLEEMLLSFGLTVYRGETDFILFYSELPLYEPLLKKGILIRDCAGFRGLSEGYYRAAVRSHEDNVRLGRAIGECIEENRARSAAGH